MGAKWTVSLGGELEISDPRMDMMATDLRLGETRNKWEVAGVEGGGQERGHDFGSNQ